MADESYFVRDCSGVRQEASIIVTLINRLSGLFDSIEFDRYYKKVARFFCGQCLREVLSSLGEMLLNVYVPFVKERPTHKGASSAVASFCTFPGA